MKDFFEKYPNAKSYFKVGDRTFLSHCKKEAELYANQNQLVLEEITSDNNESEDLIEATENNQENADQEESAQSKKIKSAVKKSGKRK